ncbi:MAG: hypothetical protein U0V56_01580 [Actinomycetota bacterium]
MANRQDLSSRDQAIYDAYTSDPRVTYRQLGKEFGLSHERVRQVIDRHGLPQARLTRALLQQRQRDEAQLRELAERVAEGRECRVCGCWILRGAAYVTCSSECARAYPAIRNIVDTDVRERHRIQVAKSWLRNGTPVQRRYARRVLDGAVEPKGRWHQPGSRASELVKRLAPSKLPPAPGRSDPRHPTQHMSSWTRRSRAEMPPYRPLKHQGLGEAVEASVREVVSRGQELRREQLRRITLFAKFAQAQGVQRLDEVDSRIISGFLGARQGSGELPPERERRLRLAALRLLFKAAVRLGFAWLDPTSDVAFAAWAGRTLRPLSDREIESCRLYAVSPSSPSSAVCWALAEAGADLAEVVQIAVGDLDLSGESVCLHGGTGTDPRWANLTIWGTSQLHRASRGEPPASTLLWLPGEHDPDRRRRAAGASLRRTLRMAGLSGDRVGIGSIRGWVGARALAEGASIDEVASYLGLHSLDEAARVSGFNWRKSAA